MTLAQLHHLEAERPQLPRAPKGRMHNLDALMGPRSRV